MSTAHTPGKWAWQKFGKEWCLTGQHGMRPIVLAVRKGALTSLVDGLLVPFDPKHPDATLIASAPETKRQRDELLAALEKLLDHYRALAGSGDCGNWDCETEAVVIQARAAIAQAKGQP